MLLESQLIIGFIFGLIIGFFSYRLKLLNLSGTIAAIGVATIVYGFGGLQYTIPIITFFVLSSLLSKFRKYFSFDVETYFEKSGTRDYAQVLANGGLPIFILLFHYFIQFEFAYHLYVASLCVAAADTWATEIGTIKKAKTYNILSLKLIHQGTSGGVSLIGTIGASLGSLTISLSALPWIDTYHLYFIISTFIVGIIGSFYDSLLGSTLQAQYICGVCKKITERKSHCEKGTSLYSGIKVFNNDVVNFTASFLGTLTMFFILSLIN